jgi:hypothetical protein
MLYGSIERDTARAAVDEAERLGETPDPAAAADVPSPHREAVQRWVRRVADGMFVTSDMALAQGLRYTSNHRDLPAGQRGFLSARAEDLLVGSDFWFSQIALLQALTLWLLADTARNPNEAGSNREAEAKIYKCCEHSRHPFVTEAVRLCAKAFRRREPANYIWLDEAGAAAKLGAGRTAVRHGGSRAVWIPPAAGWLSLAPAAQRLLGDLVVFLNLADRGRDYAIKEQFLLRTKAEESALPPCMSKRGGRAHLDVCRKLDEQLEPGAECVAGCKVRLCPYPGLGDEMARGELSEAYCRRQYELLSRKRSVGRPEWQKLAPPDELRSFWRDMERRPRS